MPDALDLLLTRRSIPANRIGDPGPDAAELDKLLTIAARVPDHGKLVPWRFITVTGADRDALASALNARLAEINPNVGEDGFAFMRDRLTNPPVMVVIVSRAIPHPKIPEWEQVLSAGAAAMNLVVGANALGYAAQWVTDWYAYDEG
ncbi:MAG: nitroreductase, partial [Hyphomicrobiales bacterium]|nr:nitroreductase [Hyphomicrobiales bacterium]